MSSNHLARAVKAGEPKSQPYRFDPGILIALAICALAVWPFVSRSALPQTTDAELHIFRVAELGRLVRSGESFPRWAPNFYYGYGYPIFNYYAPLSYYLALIPELLPAWDAVDAAKMVLVLAMLLGGLGTYGYVARIWGRTPALVATAAYVYAPFIVFVDPHARGDLAETLSFGLFPLAMWALDRLRCCPRSWNWMVAVGLVAALILSHNLMALVFASLIGAWCIWQVVVRGVPSPPAGDAVRPEGLLRYRLFLALAAGIGITAFFWLTVMLERNAVNLDSLVGEGGNFDYRNHFLSLAELLSPPALIDWSATEPDYVLGFGPMQWLLAALAVVALVMGKALQKKQATFYVLLSAGLLFLMLPWSQFMWDLLPFLPFLQFPWRLLGPAAFALAVLSAVAAGALTNSLGRPAGPWVPALLVGLILLSSLPLIQLPQWPADFGPTTALRVLQEELAGRWLGTTSTSDFVPATVAVVPGPEKALLADFYAERPLDRVNRVTLPERTTVLSEQLTLLQFRYEITSDVDFPLRLFLFDFPGWEARVDGELVETELGRPEGFVVVPVEAGRHVVEIKFTDTTARRISYAVSGLSLILVVGYGLWLRRNRLKMPADTGQLPSSVQGGANELIVLGLVAAGLFAFNAFVVEPGGLLRLESPKLEAIPAENDIYAELDGQIALIGYDLPDSAAGGSTIPFTAYWQALRTPDDNYQSFVHLVNDHGQIVAQSDALNPGNYPTERWPTDKYVRDEHMLVLPGDLRPGEYRWSVGLWSAEEGARLSLMNADDRAVGDSIVLPESLTVK